MAASRETVVASLTSSNLKENPIAECAIDRIGALGFTDALGKAFWRAKFLKDRGEEKAVVLLLAKRMGKRNNHIRHERTPILEAIAAQVVHEAIHENCKACAGRGNTIAHGSQVRHTCTSCSGSGRGRHSDLARMRATGLSKGAYHGKWERRFHDAHQLLTDADQQARRDVKAQLADATDHRVARKLVAFLQQGLILQSIEGDGPAQTNTNMPEYAVSSATG